MFDPSAAVELLARDPEQLADADLEQGLGEFGRLRSWADGGEARWLAVLGRRQWDPSDPAPDTSEKLRRRQNCSRGEARRRAKRAEQLEELPATQRALENGEISSGHADAMARGRQHADPQAKAALAAGEAELLAEGADEAPEAFAKRVAEFVKDHSADDGEEEWDRRKRSSRMWFRSEDDDGMVPFGGRLDPELAGQVKATLGRNAEELWRGEAAGRADQPMPWVERTSEQRLAEALGEVCRRADGAEVRDGRRVPARVVVTMGLDELRGGLGGDARLADGTPLPASARRMACEAGIIPVVLGGDSVPLDLGRTRRLASNAQWVALGLQYDTCTVAGCTAPFEWTYAHHIDPFGPPTLGETNLDKLIPVCGRCHDLVHRPGWRVVKDPDGTVHTWAPDGTHWEHHPETRHRRTEPRPAADPISEELFAGV
jgi:Domain of unknown function (DUF222)